MAEFDNTNRGVLFKNTRKTKPNHPDYQGTINVKGTEYRLSAWIKVSKNSVRFLSLSLSDQKQERPQGDADQGFPPIGDDF